MCCRRRRCSRASRGRGRRRAFQSWPSGTTDRDAYGRRLHGFPDVDVGVAEDQGVIARDRRRDTGLLAAGHQVVDEDPRRASGPGENAATIAGRSSTPSRYSTTTPSMRRSSPQTRSTSSASWQPCPRHPAGTGDPGPRAGDGHRTGGRAGGTGGGGGGAGEGDHLALQEETARFQREHAVLAEAVLPASPCPPRSGSPHRRNRYPAPSTTRPAPPEPPARAWASSTAESGPESIAHSDDDRRSSAALNATRRNPIRRNPAWRDPARRNPTRRNARPARPAGTVRTAAPSTTAP